MPVNYHEIIEAHLCSILDDISSALFQNNEEYLRDKARMERTGDRAEYIIEQNIGAREDRQAIEDYISAICVMNDTEARALYKQGYRDCVSLLKHIGVL